LYQRASNGTGQDELLLESNELKLPWDWSHDGRFLIFSSQAKVFDLWALPLTGNKKPIRLLQSEFNKTQGQLSLGDRWLAYTSVESGRPEVYVVPFAPGSDKSATGKRQVSTAGGTQPRWRGDGLELFYMAPNQRLMAVEVKAGPSFQHGTPQGLFTSRSDVPGTSSTQSGYAPSPDGRRFLIVTAAGEQGEQPPLTVVVNWLAAAKK
jgi:Tol biopolymer transport system component